MRWLLRAGRFPEAMLWAVTAGLGYALLSGRTQLFPSIAGLVEVPLACVASVGIVAAVARFLDSSAATFAVTASRRVALLPVLLLASVVALATMLAWVAAGTTAAELCARDALGLGGLALVGSLAGPGSVMGVPLGYLLISLLFGTDHRGEPRAWAWLLEMTPRPGSWIIPVLVCAVGLFIVTRETGSRR